MIISRERIQDNLEAYKALLSMNHKEVASHQDRFPLEINWPLYFTMEDLGLMHMVAAKDEDKLIGYTTFLTGADLNFMNNPNAWADKYMVHPDYRGQGIGDKMLEEAENWARDLGCKRYLSGPKLSQGPYARKMFDKRGFEPIELLMEKVL